MKWLVAVEKFDFWAEWSKERLWVVYCLLYFFLLRTNSKRIIRILIVSYVDGLIVVFTVSWDEFIGIVILREWNYLISDFEHRWWRWIWFPMNWREWLILNILGIKINRVFEFSENVFVSIVGYPLISFEILGIPNACYFPTLCEIFGIESGWFEIIVYLSRCVAILGDPLRCLGLFLVVFWNLWLFFKILWDPCLPFEILWDPLRRFF